MRGAAAFLVLFVCVPAAARDRDPQRHEVKIDLDISIEKQANGALLDLLYTFTPDGLDRNDEVVALLRRFVRRPLAFWVRGLRDGHTRDPRTALSVGAIVELGPAYVTGELGAEYTEVAYHEFEHGYFLLPFTIEAGARPMELLRLGAFWDARPVIANRRHPNRPAQTERSGLDSRFGGRLVYATSNDRLLLDVSGWGRVADWTFEDFHAGEITVRGFGAAVRVSFQLTSSLTLALRGEAERSHWNNMREFELDFVGSELERDVWTASGGLELLYWYRGRFAFRFGIGGGFRGEPPTYLERETPIGELSLGIVTRF